jgi:hypothetical protein
MLGQVVIDNQGIHAIVHEPLAHRRQAAPGAWLL